jgi:UDP-N-acetylglucosamine 1-carboxyvinyltransferase
MSHFEITGGVPLHGEIRCSGAKNAALPIMAAAILASEPVRLENVPRLADVRTLAQLLRGLGVDVTRASMLENACGCRTPPHCKQGAFVDGRNPHETTPTEDTIRLETVDPRPVRARERLVRQMRASFCVLGPLLARRGRAVVPLPGGCNIGHRPVDLHLKGLVALGADLRLEHGYVVAAAKRLHGAQIDLSGPDGPTVTGTANVLSAAVLAHGTTVIRGAAVEPEVVDLGRFLIAMGAKIDGLGTPTVRIEGVDQLGGTSHRLIPDRIEAATLLMAAAITAGSATVAGLIPEHVATVLQRLRAAGAEIDVGTDRVSIVAGARLRAVDLVAQPYPGAATDVQAQWTALMSVAEGVSRVQDRVFPSRFLHVAELNRLGAKITCGNGTATVQGVTHLSGARVTACDLRASAALVLAGLAAEGRTVVDHVHHLDRGYQRLDHKLRQLGAQIERARPTGGALLRSNPTLCIGGST